MIHNFEHPFAGKSVKIKNTATALQNRVIKIEDYWDRISGKSWMVDNTNPAVYGYAIRTANATPNIPNDNNVLYGKIDGLGYLVHESELEGVIS